MRRWLATMALAAAASLPVAGQARPVLVGYLPAFKGFEQIAARADWKRYTHINIAFVNPAPDGSIVNGNVMACMSGGGGKNLPLPALKRWTRAAQQGGAKVLVSLGGGTIPACSGSWSALLEQPARAKLIENLVALVINQSLDGIDVDLEGALLTEIDRAGNYTPFIAELGAALHARGKLLTCATASYEGGMIPTASVPWFDLVNVMSYDAIGPSWGRAGDEHSPLDRAERDLALWRSRGVARERLVLGIPFYGYGFGSYAPSYATSDILVAYPDAKGDVVGERCAGCSYITFNGVETLRRKSALATRLGAGVMVWEISQDTPTATLLDALDPQPSR